MAKKRKYYVVWEGHSTGIFDTWEECQLQVKSFPNAKFKSFGSMAEAEQAYIAGYESSITRSKPKPKVSTDFEDIDWTSWSVDAACSGNPGKLEYRGVHTMDNTEIFRQGPFEDGTNNIGEFLALVHALAILKKRGDNKTQLYSDSRVAMGWVRGGKAKTKLKRTRRNAMIFDLIARAEKWLKTNTFENKILKWETKLWGEIPADFGRK